MAESRLPHADGSDLKGQRIGILAALLAVVLAVVSIVSHRSHTEAILHLSVANRDWARYEIASLKHLSLELRDNLAAGFDGNRAERLRADYALQQKKYQQEADDVQKSAEQSTTLAEMDERRALHYDIGAGLLEIAVFLTSLYFLSRKSLFPAMGVIVGVLGILVAFTALVVP